MATKPATSNNAVSVTLIAAAEIAGKAYKKGEQVEVTPAQHETLIRLKAVAPQSK